MDKPFQYIESDNVVFRGQDAIGSHFIMTEAAVGGQWVKANVDSAHKAAAFGSPMDENEAKEFAGDDWPAESKVDPGS